jgi:hypothetical protein
LPANHVRSVLIDAGLTYQKTHGEAVARQFYASRGIPEELAARVLSRAASAGQPGRAPHPRRAAALSGRLAV